MTCSKPPTREQILTGIVTRLSAITRAQGQFYTDAGTTVVYGAWPVLEPADPPHTLAVRLLDQPSPRPGSDAGTVEIQAQANRRLRDPWLALERLLVDIRDAMQRPDRRLGGLLAADVTRRAGRPMLRRPHPPTPGIIVPYQLLWTTGE